MKFVKSYAALGALAFLISLPNVDATSSTRAFATRCAALARSFRPNPQTTVLLAEFLPKGSNITNPSASPADCGITSPTVMVDVCRLRLNVSTSSTSRVVFEAWMPVDWKGKRFIMTGNGGLGGCILYDDINYYASLGFAALGHDNGHDGGSGTVFYQRPEIVKDFAYRALLTATQVGKKAVNHFYQTSLKYSYIIGCSTGGRQALKAAQDFPEEFDGIISGAPAHYWNSLMSAFGYYWKFVANQQNPLVMTLEQWVAWRAEVLNQCDTIDGVADSIIENPRKCKPRPEAKLCAAGQTWESHQCFTNYQVTFLKKLYQPFYAQNGTFLYPGFAPGDELITQFWLQPSPPFITVDWYRYALYNDPTWTVENDFDFDAVDDNEAANLFDIQTDKPDLSKLRALGHKLMVYHGLSDGSLTYEGSDIYYESVLKKMRLTNSKADSFYRYFPISGLSHCGIGTGPWFVGAANQYPTGPPGIRDSAEGGVVMSMVDWVEKGKAPETILGRGIGADGTSVVARNHCKYPKKNKYIGGDSNKKTSWKCI